MPMVYPSEEFFRKYNVRTDLALEAREVIVEHEGPPEIPGVIVEDDETDDFLVSRMTIESDEGSRIMGKAKGNYVTILGNGLRQRDKVIQDAIARRVSQELEVFLERFGLGPEDPILVVGLGNWNATPDALGPRVVSKLLVTRHMYQMSPPELRGGLRPVSAVAPGVLGLTGIETGEIIQGIVQKSSPKAVICIDALASRSTERLCTTIQIADTGIHPGSGIGNKRLGITQETMGVPVIAIGVPTVVHAITIVSDAIDLIAKEEAAGQQQVPLDGVAHQQPAETAPNALGAGAGQGQQPAGQVQFNPNGFNLLRTGAAAGQEAASLGAADQKYHQEAGLIPIKPPIDPESKRQLIQKILTPYMGTMVVTPKEVDVLIEDAAQVVAGGINGAFHPGIDDSELAFYTR